MKRQWSVVLLCAAISVIVGCSDDSASSSVLSTPCTSEGAYACNSNGERLLCKYGYFEPEPCASGEICTRDGECAPACNVSSFAVTCDGDKRVYCVYGAVTTQTCENGCENGVCRSGDEACDASYASSCTGTSSYRTCEGGIVVERACESGEVCENGACRRGTGDETCDASSYVAVCDGVQHQIICKDGVKKKVSCGENAICVSGVCTSECTENDNACGENGVVISCENGRVTTTVCAAGEACKDGECSRLCEAGYVGCSADGKSYLYCANGVIKSEACQTGKRCSVETGSCELEDAGTSCKTEEFSPTCNVRGETVNCVDGKIKVEACDTTQTCYLGKCEASAPCAMSTYTPTCIDDQTHKICDGEREQFVSCGAGEICEGGVCQTINTADACTNGEAVCVDASIVKQCKDGAYHQSYCDVATEVCVAGACIEKATATVCSASSFVAVCDGDSKTVCENGYESKVACGEKYHCTDGECYPDITDGNPCDATTFVQQCFEDGTLAVCENGKIVSRTCGEDRICYAGSCQTCETAPSAATCDGAHSVKVCTDKDGGKTLETKPCGENQHCENGKCEDDPVAGDTCEETTFKAMCSTGNEAISCNGGTIETTSCSGDTPYCMNGKCVACDPTSDHLRECAINATTGKAEILVCQPDGSKKVEVTCAEGSVCYKDGCAECDPTTYVNSCTDKLQKTCTETGKLEQKTCKDGEYCKDQLCTKGCEKDSDCEERYTCQDNSCTFVAECVVGTADTCSTDGKKTRQCVAPGYWKETACGETEICTGAGVCMGTECTGTAKNYCKDNKPAQCDNGYIKPIDAACTGDNAVCVEGSCVPCQYGESKSVCMGSTYKVCQSNNTYLETVCKPNEDCTESGCVSKCGADFKETCNSATNEHKFCDLTGKIQTVKCAYNETCDAAGVTCRSDVGDACDANIFANSCVAQVSGSTTNVFLRTCDKGKAGIQYEPCNSINSFCGTLEGMTGCFHECDTKGATTCYYDSTPGSKNQIGPCVQGTDYKGAEKLGVRTADGYCDSNGFASSCVTDMSGTLVFNHYQCSLLGGTCDIKTNTCSSFTASCGTLTGMCSGSKATNCVVDPASVSASNVDGYVYTEMDCASLGATCAVYNRDGVETAYCKPKDDVDFTFDGSKLVISPTGTCDGDMLRMMYFITSKNVMAMSNDCASQGKKCVTKKDEKTGTSYAVCK